MTSEPQAIQKAGPGRFSDHIGGTKQTWTRRASWIEASARVDIKTYLEITGSKGIDSADRRGSESWEKQIKDSE